MNKTTAMVVGCTVAWWVGTAAAQKLFPDPVLEQAVRRYVFDKRDTTEPLTEKDVQQIAVIEWKGFTYTLDGEKIERPEKIKDLTGLEKCRSLALLDLEGHAVSDLTPLAELPNLQSLNLAGNNIRHLGPLAGLKGLQYLQLERNRIVDLTPLAGLQNLRSLYLSHNQITDVQPLAGLTQLWSLHLGHNQIVDIHPLAPLKSLDTLDLRSNRIADIKPLAGLAPSRFLFLQDNQIVDLGPLVEAAKTDYEGPQRFVPFWNVYLSGNPLSDEARTKQLAALRKYSGTGHIHFH